MDISQAKPVSERALTLTVLLNRHADRTPQGVAKALRTIADHLSDDFTDTHEGLLRKDVAHFVFGTDDQGNYDGTELGYWRVDT